MSIDELKDPVSALEKAQAQAHKTAQGVIERECGLVWVQRITTEVTRAPGRRTAFDIALTVTFCGSKVVKNLDRCHSSLLRELRMFDGAVSIVLWRG